MKRGGKLILVFLFLIVVSFISFVSATCFPNITQVYGNWINQSCLLGDLMNQSRSNTSYDLSNCDPNQTILEYRVTEFCDYCTPLLVNTSWSKWKNESCTPSNNISQSSFLVQYDSNNCSEIPNQIFFNYTLNFTCNYCNQRIVGPFLSRSSCNISDLRNITLFYSDLNYNSCCNLTHLPEDCDISNSSLYPNVTSTESCDYCTPKLVVSQEGTCSTNDKGFFWYRDINNCYNKTGLVSDDNIPDPVISSCDYCKPNITGPLTTNWSLCSEKGFRNRTIYYIDSNYTSCCKTTNLSSDCIINYYSQYRNKTEIGFCNVPNFSIQVNLPTGGIYSSQNINFQVYSNYSMDKLEFFKIYPTTLARTLLCTNCYSYNKSIWFNDGNYTIYFNGSLNKNQSYVSNNISLLVDTTPPQIIDFSPRVGGITNGSNFYVKYNENNLKNITLFYGTERLERTDCLSGVYKNCSFNVNLNSYDNKSIVYRFKLVDIANNTKESRNTTILVDTTPPKITYFSNFTSGKYLILNMIIDEQNFNKITYEYNDSLSRIQKGLLCSSLKNGVCSQRIYFYDGIPKIKILVLDKAGNSFEKII
jgi:hypothetical protein